ncbi:MAG: ABC transporter ATP-binding protein [Candidatus Methanofastidiosum sp.]|nr:ABC transporter ATP-binding protein [Methanofastidiosum sp.]
MKEVIKLEDAAFSYNGTAMVFENINFSMKEGDIFCILGSNGTGKSTLIKCIANLLKLKKGCVILNDRNIYGLKKVDVAKEMGYIPQIHTSTFPFSVLDIVLMGRSPHLSLMSSPSEKDYKIAENAIRTLGISHLSKKPYTEISGGERQLVLFARILAQQPSVLILDEPTSHLDFGNQIRVLEVIDQMAKNGLSILMTSHFPDHAFLVSNKVAIMKDGSLIDEGTPNEVITNESMKKIYGIDVEVTYMEGNINRKVCVPLTKNKSL